MQYLLSWCEVLLDRHHDGREACLIEENDAFEVQFGTKQIEEYILTVALVHLAALVGQLVEHGEGL